MAAERHLLTFRLDREQRQRLKARLAGDGRTMSEVVTHGLRQYVQGALSRGDAAAAAEVTGTPPRLPERVAARLRELRTSGRSEALSATLAALSEAGWPLRSLAEALGVSKQAVQRRIRRVAGGEAGRRGAGSEALSRGAGEALSRGAGGEALSRGAGVLSRVTAFEPPPPFPRRRPASANGHRPHLTIKIDHALRSAAHQAAAREGSSLSQVVETILDRYLRHGMSGEEQPPSPPRTARRSR